MQRLIIPALAVMALGGSAVMAQPADEARVQEIMVALSNFRFTPAMLTLQHGRTYKMHLVNNASGGHDFVAREFFAASTIAPADAAKVRDGEIDLDGHETVDVTVTPNQAGTYPIHCSHFMHGMFGMKGRVIVQ